jgi:hypothetical protein
MLAVSWGLPRPGTMPGRDRSRPWGAAEAGVALLLEGIALRSDRFPVNGARKGAFAWRPGGARTCATTSVRRVVHVQAADGPNSSQLEWHQIGGGTSSRLHHRSTRPGVTGPVRPAPRSALANARARNVRHDAPRGLIRPRLQSTKRPASTSRRALNSAVRLQTPRCARSRCPCQPAPRAASKPMPISDTATSTPGHGSRFPRPSEARVPQGTNA